MRLAQVVSNLVDNAAKYTPEKGHISVAVSSEGTEATLAVRDTGIGIPAERAQSIFQPFTQLAESGEMSAGGLGLGLALVRSLTELHGGAVQVVSAGPGQGSCFTVRCTPSVEVASNGRSCGIVGSSSWMRDLGQNRRTAPRFGTEESSAVRAQS